VSSLSITTRKSLMLFSGRAYPELAEEVGKYLDVTVTPQSAYDFANGEIFVRFEESVRGSDAFLIQSCGVPIVNDHALAGTTGLLSLRRYIAEGWNTVVF